MDTREAEKVFRFTDWTALLSAEDGTIFAVFVDGEPARATKVFSESKEDWDNDRDLAVVVEINGQYFRNTGWTQIGSHCYGDYEPSWNGLEEVRPRQAKVTDYEPV